MDGIVGADDEDDIDDDEEETSNGGGDCVSDDADGLSENNGCKCLAASQLQSGMIDWYSGVVDCHRINAVRTFPNGSSTVRY